MGVVGDSVANTVKCTVSVEMSTYNKVCVVMRMFIAMRVRHGDAFLIRERLLHPAGRFQIAIMIFL